jgi:hypothetical protein
MSVAAHTRIRSVLLSPTLDSSRFATLSITIATEVCAAAYFKMAAQLSTAAAATASLARHHQN